MTTGILAQIPAQATVVILRLRSLGDTVLTTPAVALLKQARPDLRIVMVVERPFDAVLAGNPDLSRVLSVSRSGGFVDRLRLIGEIRREGPQLCLNLHGGATSAWLTLFSGAGFRAGFAHYRHRFAYNVRIPRAQEILHRATDDTVHTAEHLASAIFYLGAPVQEIPRARMHAEPIALPSEIQPPYAVLHVAAAYFTKQWPAARFRAVAEFLSGRGVQPVAIAGPGEEAILQEFSGYACFGGKPLDWLQVLLANASLFVGNDSGPAHIAAAFGVPCAVIFGSSDSAVWRPWKTPHAVVETAWDCKPCPGDRCYAFDEPRCILSVEVETVCGAIDRLMAEIPDNQGHGSNPRSRPAFRSDGPSL